MTMKHKTVSYRSFAVMLGALSLIAVACSDDDDDVGENEAGKGGSTAGKGGSTAGKGGSTAGKGGTGGGGKGGTGGSSAGTAGTAGEGSGGEISEGGMPGVGGTGDGGTTGEGGENVGGEAMGGTGDGGAGGEAPIVPDTLDNGNFAAYDAGWSESGDVAAGTTKWIYGEEPGLNHYAATAFKVRTYQTVTPLPAGTYKLTAEVQKANAIIEQYLFAKGCKAGEPDTEVTAPTTAAGETGLTPITLAGIEVSSGSCTVGIYTDGPDGGWSNIDNITFVKE
jgi:hypothetical protein